MSTSFYAFGRRSPEFGEDPKKTRRLGAYLAFIDESGFLLIPTVRRTWAPRGKTPLLHHSYRRDRISTISALTISPRRGRLGLYVQFHRKNITGVEVLGFLRGLRRRLRGPIVVIWDGGSIHYRKLVQEYVRQCSGRLHVHRFPAYAPELNPAEYVWANAKRHLSNATPQDIDRLAVRVQRAMRRIARSQRLLQGCLRKSDLSF
jgi:transposase